MENWEAKNGLHFPQTKIDEFVICLWKVETFFCSSPLHVLANPFKICEDGQTGLLRTLYQQLSVRRYLLKWSIAYCVF